MSNGEIIISIATAVLVVFSVVVSIVIPGRDPNFPGRRNLVTFGIICMILVGVTLATIEIYGAEEGAHAAEVEEGESAEEPPVEEGEAVEPSPAEPEAPPAGEGEVPPPAGGQGDPVAGSAVYADNGCGNCHTLADAGSTAMIGPNLDETVPPFDLIVDRVTNGAGAMPAFPQLSATEIDDVAAYIVAATSG